MILQYQVLEKKDKKYVAISQFLTLEEAKSFILDNKTKEYYIFDTLKGEYIANA